MSSIAERSARPQLSVVVPALNAGRTLAATLAALAEARDLVRETIVADGGSRDDTTEQARRGGARVIRSEPGRGRQMAAGAAACSGDWLLFLHADTVPAPGWRAAVGEFVSHSPNHMRAAAFGLALDDVAAPARRVERLVAWRCRWLGLPYGDQGLLIHRDFYGRLGGHRPLPLMEDVDLVRRIGRRRLTILAAVAVTSAERYRRDGWWLRPFRNLACLGLYFLGMPPRAIAWLYR